MKPHEIVFVYIVACVATAAAAKVKPYMCYQPPSADGYADPLKWRCHGQLPLWTYRLEEDACREFLYGGCGGNDNSFYTREDCEEACKGRHSA